MSDIDFDFDECAGIANRPVKDLDGFVKGKLTSIAIQCCAPAILVHPCAR